MKLERGQVAMLMTHGLKLMMEQAMRKMKPLDKMHFQGRIVETVEKYKHQFRQIPRGPARARAANQLIDDILADSRQRNPDHWAKTSCRMGCAHCCHTTVLVSPDEVQLLGEKIESGEVKIDMERLEKQAQFVGGELDWWKSAKELTRCVFLGADNTCQVYADRPISCRKYYVGSPPIDCDDRNGSREAMVFADMDLELVATAACDIDKLTDPMPKAIWNWLKRKK
jgi:hypothetical protein